MRQPEKRINRAGFNQHFCTQARARELLLTAAVIRLFVKFVCMTREPFLLLPCPQRQHGGEARAFQLDDKSPGTLHTFRQRRLEKFSRLRGRGESGGGRVVLPCAHRCGRTSSEEGGRANAAWKDGERAPGECRAQRQRRSRRGGSWGGRARLSGCQTQEITLRLLASLSRGGTQLRSVYGGGCGVVHSPPQSSTQRLSAFRT